jgi:uncharacterized protein (TIGR03437 family)
MAQSPRIQWARQSGTTAVDQAHAIGYGEFGVFVAGDTVGTYPEQSSSGGKDAVLLLYDEAGTLKWVRQFGAGGNAEDVATGVAGDGSGAYVVGYTSGALQGQTQSGLRDSFIRKYDALGNVVWTRQYGSGTDDFANAVAAHSSGIYVVGTVECCASSLPGQPITVGQDAYIRKYGGDGNVLWTRMISTSNNEQATAVAADATGVYVAGVTNGDLSGQPGQRDAYVRKFSHDGNVLWTRQYSAARADGVFTNEDVFGIAVGPGGVFVTGSTAQGIFPGGSFAGGLWDGFLTKLDANGVVQWQRQIGSDGEDFPYAVATGVGHVLVVGGTSSNLVSGSFAGNEDAFLRLYDFDGNVLATRQFGNGSNDSGRGVVAYPGGYFVSGSKSGISLDLTPIGGSDAFALKVVPPPFVPEGAILNAASFAASPAPLAPGSLAVIFGAYLNEGEQVLSTIIGSDGKVALSLGGTKVTVNNVAAPMLYSIPSQVSVQIPFEVAGQSTATVVVSVAGQESVSRQINIAPAAPGFFTWNQAGTGEAVVVHQDGVSLVSAQNPASKNEVLIFYLTGLGALNPALGTGVPAAANVVAAQVTMMFGSANAVIEYAGAAPGFIGLNQINARVPQGAPVGNDVPISISVAGRQGNPVVVAIR